MKPTVDEDFLEALGWHAQQRRERMFRPLPGTVEMFLYYAMLDANDKGKTALSEKLRAEWEAQGGR